MMEIHESIYLMLMLLAHVMRGAGTFNLEENQHIYIPQGAKHRLTNRGEENLIVIEMWFGDNLDENDIKRYEDLYNRVT